MPQHYTIIITSLSRNRLRTLQNVRQPIVIVHHEKFTSFIFGVFGSVHRMARHKSTCQGAVETTDHNILRG
jgi:hypothetical protein